eukprot:TRINITY_DN23745_c0_g1_i1.p1 TRINITY_DN23745_c0_g1~~TRINITY_DN23745_c0_g1_i1.p1  ORF type:complete len:517 (+),score=154.24 TRINITY_DN23745_c0_g1_i1:46-1596(+)
MKAVLGMLLAMAGTSAAQWIDLFAPPFASAPLEMILGISCASEEACYITGGNSNTLFGIYKSHDAHFQDVERLQIGSPEPAIFLLSIAMQNQFEGVAGGVELGIGGTYYTFNGKFFNETLEVGVVTTQAIYSLGHQTYAMVGQDNAHAGPAISRDGGITFKGHWWPKDFAPNAPPRYGAFPSNTTWYITGGEWPQAPTPPPSAGTADDLFPLTSRVSFNRRTGKYVTRERKIADGVATPPPGYMGNYTAVIAKTTDGGATWERSFYNTGNYYLNQISCASETVCMAVGEGFSDDGSDAPGVHILKTEDGKTWNEIYVFGAATAGSAVAIQMVSATEAWVAATEHTGAAMLHTTDGGKTWEAPQEDLKYIGDIMAMSFINDKTAYAVAVTEFQDSTIMAMGVSPPPPGPAPVPAGTFEQVQCQNANCSVLCVPHKFPQDSCLQTSSGGSAKVSCSADGSQMTVTDYDLPNCVGPSKNETQPVNQCVKSSSGGYFENKCPGNTADLRARVVPGQMFML